MLVETAYEQGSGPLRVCFCRDGEVIPAEQREKVLSAGVSEEGQGFGLADARYIVETLNGGHLSLVPSDREDFWVLFVITL